MFEPNQLDNYNLPTYHLKFYMLSDDVEVFTYANMDPSNGIIIAESGVTGQLFIDSFTVQNFPSVTSASKNGGMTAISLELREFSGASLMDNVYAASLALNIENHHKCPYFMELSFRANENPNGTKPTSINGLSWRWPISIANMSAAVDAGGTTYNMEAYYYGEIGRQEVFSVIPFQTIIRNVTTVGDALIKLTNILNTEFGKLALTGETKQDRYDIHIEEATPELYNMRLRGDGKVDSGKSGENPADLNSTSLTID